MTTVGETTYVVANIFPSDGGAIGSRPAVFASIPGLARPLPAGERSFAYPKIVSGTSGRLHMVWAEFDSLNVDARQWDHTPTSLWHSAWYKGRWSEPERVLTATTMYWRGNDDPVVTDQRGAVHVSVSAAVTGGTPTIHHLRRDASSGLWTDTDVGVQSHGGSIVGIGRDSMAMAFVSPDTSSPRTRGSVFITRSFDGGKTWGRPTIVDQAEVGASQSPRILRSARSLEIVWLQLGVTASSSAELRLALSGDAGTTWNPPVIVPMPARTLRFSAGISPCRGTVAMVEALAGNAVRLTEVTHGDRGVETRDPFPTYPMTLSHALGVAGQKLTLVFVAVDTPGAGARSVISSRSGC